MKAFKTIACRQIVIYTLCFPMILLLLGIVYLLTSDEKDLFFILPLAAFIVWLCFFIRYRNSYSVSKISSSGVSNRHIVFTWEEADNYFVTTFWAIVNSRGTGVHSIREKCICFGRNSGESVRKQNVRHCVILPINDKVLSAIKLYRPDLFKKIIDDIRLEDHFDNYWDARLYDK